MAVAAATNAASFEDPLRPVPAHMAALLAVALAFIFVLSLYLWRGASLDRNNPETIKRRFVRSGGAPLTFACARTLTLAVPSCGPHGSVFVVCILAVAITCGWQWSLGSTASVSEAVWATRVALTPWGVQHARRLQN
jgi:hypothetical protein